MTVQDISAFESRGAPLRGSAIEPAYMSGFGNSFETEALPGALPIGMQLAAEGELRPLCRAALRLAVHGAAGDQPALLALSHPPDGEAHRAASSSVDKGLIRTAPAARDESELPIGQLRWDPMPIPGEALTFVTGLRTMTTAGDADTQAGMAAHVAARHAIDGARAFLQRRRRAAGRGAGGRAALPHRVRRHRDRARARSASSRAA